MTLWKDSIVNKLTKGVESLLKGAGVEIIEGWASFQSSKSCNVKTKNGIINIESEECHNCNRIKSNRPTIHAM